MCLRHASLLPDVAGGELLDGRLRVRALTRGDDGVLARSALGMIVRAASAAPQRPGASRARIPQSFGGAPFTAPQSVRTRTSSPTTS